MSFMLQPWHIVLLTVSRNFNDTGTDDYLRGTEIFDTLLEAKVLIERWRVHYNTVRPHSALNGQPPAPETLLHTKDFTYLNLNAILT